MPIDGMKFHDELLLSKTTELMYTIFVSEHFVRLLIQSDRIVVNTQLG
jgi:hypothetical protein